MSLAVLFVCIGNACRSQMAEGWLRHLAREAGRTDIEVFSAGSNPMGAIPEETQTVMKEVEIDLSGHRSKSVHDLPRTRFDVVISLCGDRCPFVPAASHIDWTVHDPIGEDLDSFRRVRDELRERVGELLKKLTA